MDRSRRTLLFITGTLLAIGLVMVYSASFVFAERKLDNSRYFLEHHCIYLVAGCIALVVGALWDYHALARHWRWAFGLALLLLAAVLIPGLGTKLNGARRWFSFGPVTLQPSELCKPLLILGIAGFAARYKENLGTFTKGFLPAALLMGIPVAMIALEPDLGTAGLTFCTLGAMLFAAGVRLRFALPALALAIPCAVFAAWSKLDYIQARFNDFMSGTGGDPQGKGYQVHQALIAQGSGGIFGKGLGQGHSKLLFLPESYNDFILAPIGEELGLLGSLTVVFCFGLFAWQGWKVARRAPDLLGSLIALGVTMLVCVQAAINIAVVTKSMPTKGISLPLVSYGGSSLVFLLFGIGMLLNVAAHTPEEAPPEAVGAVRRPAWWRRWFSAKPRTESAAGSPA